MLRGKTYAQHYDTHHALIVKTLDKFLPSYITTLTWSPNTKENILDHGCGTGQTAAKYLTPFAEAHDAKIYAIDISRGQIAHAKAEYLNPCVEYAQTTLLDEAFPFKDIKFNKIFSLFVLSWDSKYKETLGKMYHLLVPGGTALVVTVSKSYIFDCKKHIIGHDDWKSFSEHLHLPEWLSDDRDTNANFKEVAEGVGFKVASVDSFAMEYEFKNTAEFAEFLLAKNPHPYESHLKEDRHHEAIHAEFEKCLTDLVGDESVYEYEVIVLQLEKPL